jgi:hypothetical protein
MAKQIVNIGSSVNKGDGDPLRTAFDKINDNFDELYAATTLDLDSIGSNMIPTTDGVYALGSASKQWSDLYVKDFLYIGGVRMQADAQGNVTVDGGSLQIKDVQGDIFADDSTKVFDSATQTFTGKFEGELVGTVAADDSTVLIDGVAGTINAGALTGALPAINGSALTGVTTAFSNITSTPTTVAGYGITDAFDGVFASLTSKPTTLAGYGITDAANTSAETTFTADVKFDTGVEEKFATLTGSTGVTTMDCANGHIHYLTTPAGDITANFTNLGLTAEYATNLTVIINQGVTPYEVAAVQIGGAAQTIEWQGGSAPTGNANGIDSFSFTILNDGGTYVVLGQMVDFT